MEMARKSSDFLRKNATCSLVGYSHQEPYFLDILVSNERCDIWLYGNGKKYGILLGMSWLEDNFHLKICQKCINSRFKALELFYITPMRQNEVKQKVSFFIE